MPIVTPETATIPSDLELISLFEWNERKNNRCPECKGIYTVIRFANPSDEEYLDRVSMRFSE